MKAKISKSTIDRLPCGKLLVDTQIRGFVARRLRNGTVTYGMRYRDKGSGQRRWIGLGVHGEITADQARTEAERRRGEVADRRDPLQERKAKRAKAAGTNTVNALLDAFLERHVRENLRAADEVERVFNRYVRPRIGTKSIYELRRRDVVEILDAVEDGGAPVMADRVLAHTRKAFNWWAARDDTFVPPIVRGMARTKPAERARKRILDDQEIRDVWLALDMTEAPACYPAYVRALLLTAQRRSEVANMRWEEIEDTAAWIIPAERYKTGVENIVPLTAAVLQLLGKPLRKGFVFTTTDGELPFSGFSKSKRALDAAVAELRKQEMRTPMQPWVLHDLRRTARSLLSRAGVHADIGERVLGHLIPGVRGVYDRHHYQSEKQDALERLASLVERILSTSVSVNVAGSGMREDNRAMI